MSVKSDQLMGYDQSMVGKTCERICFQHELEDWRNGDEDELSHVKWGESEEDWLLISDY